MRFSTPWPLFRSGLSVAQSIIQLFAAGTILYGVHTLFLGYYAREWRGVQIAGVDGCAGMERAVNGDLFEGETLCHQPENFVPWIEIYRRHWEAAGIVYGVVLALMILIGVVILRWQRRLAAHVPFGRTPAAPPPEKDEHLR